MDLFGINGSEFLILALLAVIVLGPEKLPEYAQKLAQLIKSMRGMAENAKERLREEAGDELADVDWRKLDPRQYDPRKIIREALLEDDAPAPAPSSVAQQAPALPPSPKNVADQRRLAEGEAAPFDVEAT